MSVSSVENARQDLQNTKETYEEREKALVDRQKKQLAELQNRHSEALNELRDGFDKQLTENNDKTKEAISNREKRHLQEIQNLQNASRQKIAKMREEDYIREELMSKTYNKELESQKDKSSRTEQRLNDALMRESSRRDKETAGMEENYRTGSQEALREQARRLQEHFEKEREALSKSFGSTIESKDQELERTRRQKYLETNNLKTDKESQKKNLEGKYGSLLETERENYHQNLQQMKEGFNRSMTENKQRYQDLIDKNTDQFAQNFQNLKQTVDARVEHDVKNQRLINERLASENTFNKVKMQQDAAIQKANLIAGYKNSFDELEARRISAVQDSNRIKSEEVSQLQAQQSRAYEKMNQDHISKFNDFKTKVDSQYTGQIGELERERMLAQAQSESNRKKLAQNYAESILSQAEFYDDQLDAVKRSNRRTTDEQRSAIEKKHSAEVNTIRDKMLKQSMDNQQKVTELNEKYQTLINSMKTDYEKKMRKQAEAFREETERQSKYATFDREATEAKFQARVNQLKENFEKEIEQVKRKQYQEKSEAALNKKA